MDTNPPERATEIITLLASREVLDEILDRWSGPVQIMATRTPGVGTGWDMTIRQYDPVRDST